MSAATERAQWVLDHSFVGSLGRKLVGSFDLIRWRTDTEITHTTVPPHMVKRHRIAAVAAELGCSTLIETGTYLGDMVQFMLPMFERIHSIELSPFYYQRACRRFSGRPSVSLHQGDSATILPQILTSLQGRAVIWLDAHWSGGITARSDVDTPVVAELEAIANYPQHCVLIDDAHCFDGSGGYPRLSDLREITQRLFPVHRYSLRENIVELLPS